MAERRQPKTVESLLHEYRELGRRINQKAKLIADVDELIFDVLLSYKDDMSAAEKKEARRKVEFYRRKISRVNRKWWLEERRLTRLEEGRGQGGEVWEVGECNKTDEKDEWDVRLEEVTARLSASGLGEDHGGCQRASSP